MGGSHSHEMYPKRNKHDCFNGSIVLCHIMYKVYLEIINIEEIN